MTLSLAEMQQLGTAAIELISRRLVDLGDQRVAARWSRGELEQRLMEPVPTGPQDPLDVLARVAADVLPACAATDHPRFFAYVPGPGNFVAAVADFIAAGANVFAGHWLVGAGAAEVELVVLAWLRELLGLPDTGGGLLTNGGTSASLIAVHAARHRRFGGPSADAVIYVSDQTHASVVRGLEYIGFGTGQLHRIPVNADLVMDLDHLRQAVGTDLARGAVPFCVIATAGTTSTGAVDPLTELADICAESDLWLHVDAAYGGAAVLVDDGRKLLAGLPRADSIAIDPHKWWFQPYEAGCLLVRDAEALRAAYSLHAGYLTETLAADPVNFYDYGPQLTRSFRALKLWMTIQVFGLDAMRAAVDHGVKMAEYAESLLRNRTQWTVVTPAQLGIVTFRPSLPERKRSEVDEIVRDLAEEMLNDGYALVLTTDWGDGPVLRLCMTHPRTTELDVVSTLDLLDRMLHKRLS
ncbi:aminotransferase class I/II-fold pyridoxal phosphate-dependent enzyme [Kribbella swartbergensis]